MGSKGKPPPVHRELFRPLLMDLISDQHPLVVLEGLIDWSVFETRWAALFVSTRGRPATSPRLIAGLLYCHKNSSLYVIKMRLGMVSSTEESLLPHGTLVGH